MRLKAYSICDWARDVGLIATNTYQVKFNQATTKNGLVRKVIKRRTQRQAKQETCMISKDKSVPYKNLKTKSYDNFTSLYCLHHSMSFY